MPLQNRVTPTGELVAAAARGTLMGNRGCLHDGGRTIRRAFVGRRWILCRLAFGGRHREVMSPGRYTELFFLDEATGLAAGHRPCAECQRARYHLFRDTWAAANPGQVGTGPLTADRIDAALHAERLGPGGAKQTFEADIGDLPVGVMVRGDGPPLLVGANALRPWSVEGYGPPVPRPAVGRARVLTPRSVVRAIEAGFAVDLHPSAGG